MLKAMLGFDGIAIPQRWANMASKLPFAAQIIRGVEMPNPVVGWFWLSMHLDTLIVIVVALPNGRQLFFNQHACKDQIEIHLPTMRRLGLVHGMAAGILLTGFLYSRYSAVPSPFIYFNF